MIRVNAAALETESAPSHQESAESSLVSEAVGRDESAFPHHWPSLVAVVVLDEDEESAPLHQLLPSSSSLLAVEEEEEEEEESPQL